MNNNRVKNVILILVLVIVLIIPCTAYATELTDEVDAALISDEIVEFVNGSIAADEFAFSITKDDFDLADAFVFYVDTNIFKVKTNNISKVEKVLSNGDYMFEVPIYLTSGTYMVDISKGLPVSDEAKKLLSDEEILDLESKVGKWKVQGGGFYEGEHKDYVAEVRTIVNDENAEPIFVGGMPYFREPVALVSDKDGRIDKLVPLFPGAIQWEQLKMESEEGDVVFDYVQLKEHVAGLPPVIDPHGSTAPIGGMYMQFVILGIATILVILCIVFLYKNGVHKIEK